MPCGTTSPKLGYEASDLVRLCSTGLDHTLSSSVQRRDRLLFNMLDWYKAHRSTGHRFANCFGISRVMLVGLDVWFNELRCHELDCVSSALQFARPVMGAATCSHADKTRRQVDEENRHLFSFDLFLEHCFAVCIGPVNLKHVLCQIDADCRNLHGDAPLDSSGWLKFPFWHI
jgi:hypothetical protein